MAFPDFKTISGDPRIAVLANEISDAINAAMRKGVPTDVACSVAARVAADYGRGEYGPDFCDGLAELVKMAKVEPLPADISRQ